MNSSKFDQDMGRAAFDYHDINHMVCALQLEMGAVPGQNTHNPNLLFMGGAALIPSEVRALSQLALDKNWSILFASCDPENPDGGPSGIHLAVTDGQTTTIPLAGGRLWKRNAKAPTIVLFPGVRLVAKLSSKGRLMMKATADEYHEEGFDLARASLKQRTAKKPARSAVISSVGTAIAVMDIRTLNLVFEMA